jgi:hypothetical protein
MSWQEELNKKAKELNLIEGGLRWIITLNVGTCFSAILKELQQKL